MRGNTGLSQEKGVKNEHFKFKINRAYKKEKRRVSHMNTKQILNAC